jgi:hypothetical protein
MRFVVRQRPSRIQRQLDQRRRSLRRTRRIEAFYPTADARQGSDDRCDRGYDVDAAGPSERHIAQAKVRDARVWGLRWRIGTFGLDLIEEETLQPLSVETIALNPSHLTSNPFAEGY